MYAICQYIVFIIDSLTTETTVSEPAAGEEYGAPYC